MLRAAESVWTPAGQEHFHGGTAGNMMCHYAIGDAARRDHDHLFGDRVPALAQTDPELIAGGLDIRTRLTVQLAALDEITLP